MIVIKFFSAGDYDTARQYLNDDTNYKFNEFPEQFAIDVFDIDRRSATNIANAFGGKVLGEFAYRDGDALVTLE